MRLNSLRTRLLLISALSLLLGLGSLVVAGNVLVSRVIDNVDVQRLNARLDAGVAAFSLEHGHLSLHDPLDDATFDQYSWVFTGGRAIQSPTNVRPALDAAAHALATTSGAPRLGIGPILLGRRILRSAPGGPVLAVAVAGVDAGPLDALRRDILFGCLAVAGLIVAAGTLASLRVLGSALDPVEQMTAAAEEWEAHDLDRRFDLGPARDEITHLAATLDHLLDRIASSRRHEQRLAAEVAHELRNPLATITTSAELALEHADPGTEAPALMSILDQARQMAATIEVILAHARGDGPDSADGADLARVLAGFDGVGVAPPAEPGVRVEGSDDLLRQALAPIVENARRHAHSRVWFEVDEDPHHGQLTIAVRDDGPGVDPGLGSTIFEAGVSGDGGVGLGLALAQRLIGSCGGRLSVGPGPGGEIRVRLPRLSPSR